MTVEAAIGGVLAQLSDAQIEALAVACRKRAAPGPNLGRTVTGAPVSAHDAVASLAEAWAASPGLTGAGVALALRTGLVARRDADARRARPVWTGPCASGEQRLTAAVLTDLVSDASERILVVSFAAYTLLGLGGQLTAAVDRGCMVDVVFETKADSGGGYSGAHSVPFSSVAGITRWRWPAERRKPGALLHAKLLVVDGRRALVGSANLTERALTANLEAGVLIEDRDVAGRLEQHMRRLMDHEILITA